MTKHVGYRYTHPSVTLACIRRLPAVAVSDIMAGQHAGTGLAALLVAVLRNAVRLYSMGITAAATTKHENALVSAAGCVTVNWLLQISNSTNTVHTICTAHCSWHPIWADCESTRCSASSSWIHSMRQVKLSVASCAVFRC